MKTKKSIINSNSSIQQQNKEKTIPNSNESRAMSRPGKAISIITSIVDLKPGFIKKLSLAKTSFDYSDENKDSKLKVRKLDSLFDLL